jgi:hypothetical protein
LILYVNGDSHSAGAEAAHESCFINEGNLDHYIPPTIRKIWKDEIDYAPHPDNVAVSYGQKAAEKLQATLHCHARSGASNSRIIRTTKNYLSDFKPDLVVIGWSTWEREEWFHDGKFWQISAGGIGSDWPDIIRNKYKNWVLELDWNQAAARAHKQIYDLHIELKDLAIPHLFFNTFNHFENIDNQKNWYMNYIEPYSANSTYYTWLIKQNFQPNLSFHFQADAHRKWAEFLLPRLTLLL